MADFRGLRHRFTTDLVRAGVAPKEPARHSTITLTTGRYAHVGVRNTAAAVAKLTLPVPPQPQTGPLALRATETDGPSSDAVPDAVAGGNERSRTGLVRKRDRAAVSAGVIRKR
ncbi:MAG: hypothetical protein K2X82_27175 [Gemmataceae bacterium]|nr:hypothetical protein [Gemmataceae bacterium]